MAVDADLPRPEGPRLPPASTAMPDGGDVVATTPIWRLTLSSFLANKLAVTGVAILVFFVLFCFVGPLLYHTNQAHTDIGSTDLTPSGHHPLGTDSYGFDELGRIMKGGQSALEIGFLTAVIATVIGTLWGAVAGLVGGVVDALMMRVVDIMLAIPFLFIVLIIATKVPATVLTLSLVLGVFSWLVPARLVRGEVLTLRVRDFVSAARVMGGGRWHIVRRHLIPNALGTVIVNITFQVADAILAVAYLGFLSFGLNYPQVDWGDMLSDGVNSLLDGYWWLIYPVGVCLIAVIMAANFVGEGLREAIDARTQRR